MLMVTLVNLKSSRFLSTRSNHTTPHPQVQNVLADICGRLGYSCRLFFEPNGNGVGRHHRVALDQVH
jgi:hypothetical protein